MEGKLKKNREQLGVRHWEKIEKKKKSGAERGEWLLV